MIRSNYNALSAPRDTSEVATTMVNVNRSMRVPYKFWILRGGRHGSDLNMTSVKAFNTLSKNNGPHSNFSTK